MKIMKKSSDFCERLQTCSFWNRKMHLLLLEGFGFSARVVLSDRKGLLAGVNLIHFSLDLWLRIKKTKAF